MLHTCKLLAGEADTDGALVRGMLPIGVDEIIAESGDPPTLARKSFDHLISVGLIEKRGNVFFIPAHHAEQECTSRNRTRTWRERHRDRHGDGHRDMTGDDGVARHGDAVGDGQKKRGLETVPSESFQDSSDTALVAPLRPLELRTAWPKSDDAAGLMELAREFISAFANTRDPKKVDACQPDYCSFLASTRGRGNTIADAWTAAGHAWLSRRGKPLHKALIKFALSHLPPASRNGRYDPNAGKMAHPDGQTPADKIAARTTRGIRS